MKTIIFFLLISTQLFSQDLNYLKSQDTLYIVLKNMGEGVTSEKTSFEKFRMESFGNGKEDDYNIIDSLNRSIIIMVPKDIKKPDEDKALTVNRKKFIKKYKDSIITVDFLKRYYPEELFFGYLGVTAYYSYKVIYIIDENSLKRKDKNLVLRKAFIAAFSFARI